ncbi:mitotic control protein dis3 [Cryptosporidium ryanae]|uniref:mitotic control protein dis3 n=1 Tax=Cryptosporidium ryanae TaxID=515981 RepID=UPI003519E1BC|nr:mitotic control protein dis3 [Cryptosporidium ryanae]
MSTNRNNLYENLEYYIKYSNKKTKRGKIRKISKEVYLRNRTLCGIGLCKACYGPHIVEELASNTSIRINLVFPNYDIISKYADFILEDESINYLIIPNSVIEYLNEINKQFVVKLKNKLKSHQLSELPLYFEESRGTFPTRVRNFNVSENKYVQFLDTQCKDIQSLNLVESRTIEEMFGMSVTNTFNWYLKHFSNYKNNNIFFYLLTYDKELTNKLNNFLSPHSNFFVLNPYDFVKEVSTEDSKFGEKLPPVNICQNNGIAYSEIIFSEHLAINVLEEGIKEGKFFKGILKMISRDTGEIDVINYEGKDIVININGWLNLNRCIDGDLVVVEIIDNEFEGKDCNIPIHFETESGIDQVDGLENKEISGIGTILLGEDDYDENHALDIQNVGVQNGICNEVKIDVDLMYSGRVVGILQRNWSEYCGSLIPLDENDTRYDSCYNSSTRQHRIFVPINPKIPKIIIHTKLSATLEFQRLIVVIDNWDRNSFYPTGHWVGVLGAAGDLETETSVILRSRSINSSEFSPKVLQCLPNYGGNKEWVPTQFDLIDRLDLRNKLVFSIDPPGCKDIDDALSIELIQKEDENSVGVNWYKVGVHIADVTHFVKPNTPLDDEAARRCTTCYLVNRRIDMLPEELTTEICSLVSNKDRLAFSCHWEINDNAEVRKFYFNKSIINSKHSFTYLQAQNIINDIHDNSEVAKSLRTMLNISKILRKNRIERGAIELSSSEVKIDFEEYNCAESNTGLNIKDISMYITLSTNFMVEEFMLLANVTVARFVSKHFPSCSLLRKHPEPKYNQLKKLENMLSKVGINSFKYGTSLELANSLNNIKNNEVIKKNPIIERLIRILTTRTMNQAIYFLSCKMEEGTYHYGLAEDIYTHFTSPIRRYADIIVHRLLAASIGIESLDSNISNKDKVSFVNTFFNFFNILITSKLSDVKAHTCT